MSETKIDGRTREGRARRKEEEAPVQAAEAPAAPSPRARETREASTQRERRRRGDISDHRRNLSVNEAKLDRENYEYRYIVDRGNRLHAMTELDDWDIVSQESGEVKADSTDMGASVSIVSGTKKTGEPERLFLCRKPKEWAMADRAEKDRARNAVDQQIKSLAAPGSNVSTSDGFYSTGQTSIERR